MKNINYINFTLFLFLSFTAYSQDVASADHNITISVDEVFIMDIESSGSIDIDMGLTSPDEAGAPMESTPNSSLWINYTSVLEDVGSESRNITAQTSAATPGYILKVIAAADAGNGEGTTGTPTGEVTLSNTMAQNIIESIGSAYTGDGASNGHNLTYTLESQGTGDFSNLQASTGQTITVTYTITN